MVREPRSPELLVAMLYENHVILLPGLALNVDVVHKLFTAESSGMNIIIRSRFGVWTQRHLQLKPLEKKTS